MARRKMVGGMGGHTRFGSENHEFRALFNLISPLPIRWYLYQALGHALFTVGIWMDVGKAQ